MKKYWYYGCTATSGHKPIISVSDYDKVDGKYANATDAMALSIGLAQYDRSDISLKVWRYTNDEKWSRQSEELPVHRNLDLTILFLTSLLISDSESEEYTQSIFLKNFSIDNPELIRNIQEEYNGKYIKSRLKEIRDLLNKILK